MKGLLLRQAGGDYSLVDDIEKPVPGKEQVLVKSLVTAINPVEGYMQGTGLLITAWPIVLGCDASGVVVELGEGVTKYKKGDGILGCTMLGTPGHSTFQEYFLMNEDLSIKRPEGITSEQAATVGVGALTAAHGVFSGTNLEFKAGTVNSNSPWYVVLGAAGSVGQYAVQLLKLCGYKVIGSCSDSNAASVKALGADATFSYKLSLEEQIAEIEKVTGGNYSRVFDASAVAEDIGIGALAQNKSTGAKYFSTVNDWSPIASRDGVEVHKVTLGDIGRTGNEHSDKVNKELKAIIPTVESFLQSGQLKPQEYIRVGDVGVGEIFKALEAFKTHKSGKKIVVRLAED